MAAVTAASSGDFKYDSITEWAAQLMRELQRWGLPTGATSFTCDVTGDDVTITFVTP